MEGGTPVGGQEDDPGKGILENAGPRGGDAVVGEAEEREGAVAGDHEAGGEGADAVLGGREVEQAEGWADAVVGDREVEEVEGRTDAVVDQ